MSEPGGVSSRREVEDLLQGTVSGYALTTTELIGETCRRAIDGHREGRIGLQRAFAFHDRFAGEEVYLRLVDSDIQAIGRHFAVTLYREDERVCVRAQQEKG